MAGGSLAILGGGKDLLENSEAFLQINKPFLEKIKSYY